jgi:WD40 repeat protein
MAVNRQPILQDDIDLISPLTLDSVFFPEDGFEKQSTPVATTVTKPEETNINFDSAGAIIWKEISREIKVTAVAISRPYAIDSVSLTPSASLSSTWKDNPLLLAMGDENGNVVVTQIVDNGKATSGLGCDAWPDSNMEIPSEALAYSVEGRIRSIDFGSNNYLAVGGDGCCAWILQLVYEEHTSVLQYLTPIYHLDRVDRIYAVQFSPDSRFLVVGGYDGKAALIPMTSIWDQGGNAGDENDEDSLLQVLRDSIIELDRPGLINCLDWSPNGDFLAIGSNKQCGIYDVSSLEVVHETPRRLTTIQALQFNRDGSYLAIGERDVVILEGKPPFKIHCEISNTPKDSAVSQFRYRITSLCWSPSGAYLAIAGSDGACLVVETKGYALVHQIQRPQSITALAWGQQRGLNNEIRRYLAISDEDCNVALIKAGVESHTIEHADDYSSVASSSHFSSPTTTEWVLRDDAFRDVEDAEPPRFPQESKSRAKIMTVAFSRRKNSSYLAYAADDCSLTIVTTRDWKAVFVSI